MCIMKVLQNKKPILCTNEILNPNSIIIRRKLCFPVAVCLFISHSYIHDGRIILNITSRIKKNHQRGTCIEFLQWINATCSGSHVSSVADLTYKNTKRMNKQTTSSIQNLLPMQQSKEKLYWAWRKIFVITIEEKDPQTTTGKIQDC